MARLTHANGAEVEVADDRVDALLARGFTRSDGPKKAAPAKKAAAKKSS